MKLSLNVLDLITDCGFKIRIKFTMVFMFEKPSAF